MARLVPAGELLTYHLLLPLWPSQTITLDVGYVLGHVDRAEEP